VKCSDQVSAGLNKDDIEPVEFNGSLLCDPTRFSNKTGKPYQVFRAFKRGLLHVLDPGPLVPRSRKLHEPRTWPTSAALKSLRLLPKIRWYKTMEENWVPGEQGANQTLTHFLRKCIDDYSNTRNIPAVKRHVEIVAAPAFRGNRAATGLACAGTPRAQLRFHE